MFSKGDASENCYFCAIGPLIIYIDIFGLTCTCEKYEIKKCTSYHYINGPHISRFFKMLNLFLLNGFSLYSAYEILYNSPKESLLYLVLLIGAIVYFGCGGSLIIRIINSNHHKIQVNEVQNLMSDCKLYGINISFPYEALHRVRRIGVFYFWSITSLIIIFFTYFAYRVCFGFHISFYSFRVLINTYCMLYHVVFDSALVVDCLIFHEIMMQCFKEIKNILINPTRYDPKKKSVIILSLSEKLTNRNRIFKTVEERLKDLNRLYTRLMHIVEIYGSFIGSVFIFTMPIFTFVEIMGSYAFVKFIINDNRKEFQEEYLIGAVSVSISFLSFIYASLQCDRLPRGVSTIVSNIS